MLEISQSSLWRKKLFESQNDKKFEISSKKSNELPEYIKNIFKKYNLRYYVSKIESSPENFATDLIIFKFESCRFSSIVGYSGNNQNVF